MGEPFVTRDRLRQIVARTNALGADLIVVLGDLIAGHHYVTEKIPVAETAAILAGLKAPLGVHAINGNHDWWDDRTAQRTRQGPIIAHRALEANGIAVLENRAARLENGVWLAGIGSQVALVRRGGGFDGVDDLPGTLAQVPEGAPAILLMHEPDLFPEVPGRIPLTLAGHTHGGQVRLMGFSPVVPSRFGNRFAYGPVTEEGRHLVVSGGIGCSIMPVRFGVVPEITVVEMSRG
jgi:predicted MPP superfamily phosphohydrolase